MMRTRAPRRIRSDSHPHRIASSLSGRIDSAVRAGLGQDYPGAVVLAMRGSRVLHAGAYGFAQVEPVRVAMRSSTIFDLASLTKPLATGTALALLLDAGRLTLRDRVSRYLPRFTGGGKEAVTLLDLATHSGGLDDAGLYDHREPMKTTAKVFDHLWTKTLFAPPGTAYRYADYNYITLGRVVEEVSGTPLDRFFADRIAGPLGMKATGYRPPKAKWARCAATERREDRGGGSRVLRGQVHDPRAWDLGGVAGHAGLFGTAAEVAVIPRMLLARGRWKGRTFLTPATAALCTRMLSPAGLRPRGLGWDSDPDGYGPRGDLFPAGGFGHTGFTGTSIWCDPGSDTVVVVLTNRVHPAGGGNADPLRRRVANLVAAAVTTSAPVVVGKPSGVLTGCDVLAADGFRAVAGKKIGLVTNLAVVNRDGRTTLEALRGASDVTIAALFSPEHGLDVAVDEPVASGEHRELRIPVHSLYGDTRRPKPGWLRGLDALVVDLPDVGVRFYTYHATLGHCLEAAANADLPVIVLDRPNPITGSRVEGPRLPKARWGFTGYSSFPVRHGMTMGELGRWMNGEHRLGADLTVIPMRGWRRGMWFDETGLSWVNPSPNLRTLTQAILYPAVGLLEATNLTVGRGTDAPFEHLGAPWLDAPRIAAELNARRLPGIGFYPASVTPASSKFAHERCGVVRLHLTDREAFRPVLTGLTLVSALLRVHPDRWEPAALDALLGVPEAREALVRLDSPDRIADGWRKDEDSFMTARKKYLLY